jgi:hypothetical protein
MIKHLFFALSTLIFPHTTVAEIYKHVDAEGRVTYSNIKTKGAVKLELDGSGTRNNQAHIKKPAPNQRTATPENFPRVTKDAQTERDAKRRSILQAELDAEKVALEDAKKAYAEGEEKPEVYRTANGGTFRNVPKFEAKMKALQENVDNHQRNIELLQKELDALL